MGAARVRPMARRSGGTKAGRAVVPGVVPGARGGARGGAPCPGGARGRARCRQRCPGHALPRPGDPQLLQSQPTEAAHPRDNTERQEDHRDVARRLPAGGGGGGGGTRGRFRAGPECRPPGRRREALAAAG